MSSRAFRDRNGVEWRVWSTIPSNPHTLGGEFGQGWLTFESEVGRRRLAPIPAGWEDAPDSRLELYRQAARETVVRAPRRPESSASD